MSAGWTTQDSSGLSALLEKLLLEASRRQLPLPRHLQGATTKPLRQRLGSVWSGSDYSSELVSRARAALLTFCRLTFPNYLLADHLYRLAGALSAVEAGRIRRLIVTLPPRHGKSLLCSVQFPAWALGRNPDRRVIVASYAADLAERFSRQVRATIATDAYQAVFPGVTLAPDSRSVAQWDIAGRRGGLKAVGVGGPITGHGADIAIVDDPHKNREEAVSKALRDRVWEWYKSTLYTRLEPKGALVVIATRWHTDDLVGRILAEEAAGVTHEGWRVLKMPAVDADGNALWPERYGLEELEKIRTTLGVYNWSALYLCEPIAPEGAMFQVDRLNVTSVVPHCPQQARAWDVAATSGAGDYTAGVRLGAHESGYVVLDVVRGQWDPATRNEIIRRTAMADGQGVLQVIPQDPGAAGVDMARQIARLCAGSRIRIERVSGSKTSRADPVAAHVSAGTVSVPAGAQWLPALIAELEAFPLGPHDDQVDALASAFNALAGSGAGVNADDILTA